MAFTQLGHALVIGGGGSPVTIPAQNTIGAKVIVLAVTGIGTGVVPTDNQGNTYLIGAPYQTSGSSNTIALFYCLNPVTSATHTFLYAAGTSSLAASWWSSANPPLKNQQNASTTSSPGSVTPTANGALIITAASVGGGGGFIANGINAGFTILDQGANNSASFGLSQASILQATAAAIAPTWTGTGVHASAILAFIEQAPVTLSALSAFSFQSTVNMAVGGLSFASVSAMQLLSVADLAPGFRPPAFLLPSGYETLEDNAGASVPGGLVWTYQAGTTTPLPTYTDTTLTVVNTNPIVCDAAGRWAAWVPIGTSYKLVFETPAIPPAHGSVIRTVDGLQVFSLPTWAAQPYNIASFTAVGGGTWTVDPGDVLAYQYMLDGKRLLLNLAITNTSITGAVTAVKVALPAGIVSAGWPQVGPALIFDNSNSIGSPGYWQVDPSTASIYFGLASRANLAVSVNQTWIWFSGMIAIT